MSGFEYGAHRLPAGDLSRDPQCSEEEEERAAHSVARCGYRRAAGSSLISSSGGILGGSRPDEVVVVLDVVFEGSPFNFAESSFEEHPRGEFLSPHGAKAHPALGQGDRHAMHA